MADQSSSFQRSVITTTLVMLLLLSGCDSKTSDLNATILDPPMTGFLIIGNGTDHALGLSVKTAGDIDNDGYKDIIVGSHRVNKGAAYVIYGGPKSSMSDIDLRNTTLDPATTGFMISGNLGGVDLGWSVSTAGDINNDGYDDIIIGAYQKNSNQRVAYVIYGGPKSSMSNIDLSFPMDPLTTGFMITLAPSSQYGNSVSTGGDINNDGYDDIIFGIPSPQGVAYVIYGGPKSSMSNIDLNTTTLDPATTGFMITTLFSGFSVSTAGDINHDGFDDIIAGVSGKNMWKGEAYVIYGGPKSSMSNVDLIKAIFNPQTTGFVIAGGASFNSFGSSVSTAGDMNKDGFSDIIVGASVKNGYTGAAYVIYGGPKSLSSNIDLSSKALDPATTGFMISGNDYYDDFGSSVSTAGDINNDGFDDIIVGAWGHSARTGAAYVVYGGPKSSMSNIDLNSTKLDPATTGFTMIGNARDAQFGLSVSTTGDINHDGYEDIIIGAPNLQTSGITGGAYVVYGGEKPSMSNISF